MIDFICGQFIKSGGYKGVFIGYACPPEYFVDFEYEAETTTVWSLGIVMYRTVCGRQPFTDQHDGLSFDSRVSTDGSDLRPSLRLSRQSITSLIAALRSDFDHGWETDIEVLVFLYWLAHAASYRVVSMAFDIPKKLFHSVQLQAITDHKGKFIDIFDGYPGSVHDARVLKNSPVYTGRLYPPAGKCILGDGGYPCLSAPICLITPYREPVQNPVQARFNAKHAHARNIVERAFGMLKTRWRSIFFKALEVSPAFVPEVVACCAVLHNLCLQNGDIVDAEVVEDPADDPPEPQNTEASAGEDVRDNLAAAVSAPDNCVPALHEHDYL
ncbi:nuclease HARBI1 [Labeo rohita]|uniref:Nuclease HARBI1 n=1 Tax=Labeo rohita TaxID=84645 RepID=A0A498LC43_LABRO|nr:nuclease HARBI1 [Labeo rohita]